MSLLQWIFRTMSIIVIAWQGVYCELTCDIESTHQKPCEAQTTANGRFFSISRESCLMRGCCYSDSPRNIFTKCYKKARAATAECDVPAASQRRCGGKYASSNEMECERLGCCYRARDNYGHPRCYMKKYRTLSWSWQATAAPGGYPQFGNFLAHGGEPGSPGSKLVKKCNPGWIKRKCFPRLAYVNEGMCQRASCCWNEDSRSCFLSTFHITYLRKRCPPGFKNPPRCTDSYGCTNKPCENNGKCINEIHGFKCQCQPGYGGQTCSVDCHPNPVTHNAQDPLTFITIPADCQRFQQTILTTNAIFEAKSEIDPGMPLVSKFLGSDFCKVLVIVHSMNFVETLDASDLGFAINVGPILATFILDCQVSNSQEILLASLRF